MLSKNNYKAMTLVEILVVLGIIIAISAVVIVVINPATQRARSQDAVLKSTVASIGQSMDSFYGLRGYYPDPAHSVDPGDLGQLSIVDRFVSDGVTVTRDSAARYFFTASGVVTNDVTTDTIPDDTIVYYRNDFIPNGSLDLPCIEAVSNENPAWFIAWAPGFAVTTLINGDSCSTEDGYEELTGLEPLPL